MGELGLAFTGRIAGTAAGAVIVALPLSVFGSLFALMILAAIALSMTRWRLLPTPRNLLAAGLASGFMGTITSVGAPPMALVYQNMPGPKVRATMGAFLMLGAAFSLVTLAVVGRFTAAQACVHGLAGAAGAAGFLVVALPGAPRRREQARHQAGGARRLGDCCCHALAEAAALKTILNTEGVQGEEGAEVAQKRREIQSQDHWT